MKRVDLEFGKFEFYPEIIVARIKEGVHFDLQKNEILVENVLDHYGIEMPLSYISIREKNYSVDPMVYQHNKQYDNLCGIAIVQDRNPQFCSIDLESRFFREGQLLQFTSIEDAVVWANQQVQKKLADNDFFMSLN